MFALRSCLILFSVSLAFSACENSAKILSGKPTILSTTTFVGDLVEQLVEEEFESKVLMGPGVDPHLYKAKPSDIRALKKADIIFYSGLGLEGKLIEILEAQRSSGKRVRAVTENIPHSKLIKDKVVAGKHYDPHVWFDVSLWILSIDVVVGELGRFLPERASVFVARGEALKQSYRELDSWIKKEISKISPRRRVLITSHDAFSYFGRAYGLKVHGIQGVSTAAEAGLRDVLTAIEIIKRRKIPTVFVESSVSPALMKRVSRDGEVTIGGSLYSDATGIPNLTAKNNAENPATFEGALRSNVNKIVEGLSQKLEGARAR